MRTAFLLLNNPALKFAIYLQSKRLLRSRPPHILQHPVIHLCRLSSLGRSFSMIAPSEYTLGVPAEDIAQYCPGGYHPVHLGDCFKNGQYQIIHKLGFGSFSTVWLARDLQYVLYLRLLSLGTPQIPTERTVT